MYFDLDHLFHNFISGMEGVFLIVTVMYVILFLKLYSYICTMEWLRRGKCWCCSRVKKTEALTIP